MLLHSLCKFKQKLTNRQWNALFVLLEYPGNFREMNSWPIKMQRVGLASIIREGAPPLIKTFIYSRFEYLWRAIERTPGHFFPSDGGTGQRIQSFHLCRNSR